MRLNVSGWLSSRRSKSMIEESGSGDSASRAGRDEVKAGDSRSMIFLSTGTAAAGVSKEMWIGCEDTGGCVSDRFTSSEDGLMTGLFVCGGLAGPPDGLFVNKALSSKSQDSTAKAAADRRGLSPSDSPRKAQRYTGK